MTLIFKIHFVDEMITAIFDFLFTGSLLLSTKVASSMKVYCQTLSWWRLLFPTLQAHIMTIMAYNSSKKLYQSFTSCGLPFGTSPILHLNSLQKECKPYPIRCEYREMVCSQTQFWWRDLLLSLHLHPQTISCFSWCTLVMASITF